MAIKSKTQLTTDIAASTFTAPQQTILTDMVDSYEDIFAQVTTVQRDALTPVNGQIVYNTDNDRYEYWNGAQWFALGQNVSTPLTVKIDLSAADLATLFSTPVDLVPAPPTGYYISPIKWDYRYTYGSAVYDFTGVLAAFFSTKTSDEMFFSLGTSTINANASRSGTLVASSDNSKNSIADTDKLILQALLANPTTGDGTLTIWVTYSINPY